MKITDQENTCGVSALQRLQVFLMCVGVALTVFLTPYAALAQKQFAIKGFHLDLRIQVMKMSALKAFAKELSANSINTLIMEWEATYPFQKHPVIASKLSYKRKEIEDFVSYCEGLGIDVIPLQQSFGHVEYILKHYRYRDLREDQKNFSQVNPLRESLCKTLFSDLYKDLISTHRSQYFHIGGDETYLLGSSKESKEKVDKLGMGRLYGDYIKMLCELVVSLGKTPLVWADIALKYPDALKSLPKETIFIDWNYGWELDRFGDHHKLMESGFEIWGSPAIRSNPDNYFLTDWMKHLENINSFIPQARQLGYKGLVMTSWSTSGIYSSVMESHSDLMDQYAIRRVYPISGFDLSIKAFFQAVKQQEPLDIKQFINNYARDVFGLDEKDRTLFAQALASAPYEINQGVVSSKGLAVSELRDSAYQAWQTLENLKVKRNTDKFDHYKLMANIRYNYLVCMEIEAALNQPSFNQAAAADALARLHSLNVKDVNKRFNSFNKTLLYADELETESQVRNHRYHDLLARLQKMTGNAK